MTLSDQELRELLQESRTIAVIGLSPNPMRPSNSVSQYMQRSGYTIVPVNPGHGEILGEKSYRTLTDAARKHDIDIVNIFRRSEHVAPIVDEAIAIKPKLIWLQLGIVDHDAQERAAAAGVPFIMDHCLAIEHGRLKD
ncbi:MAG: CoA-binding protein [Gemmatimonadetes bacterium]|nr:MAG: CoA-binding protein [Gemmatimonadota bacterium]